LSRRTPRPVIPLRANRTLKSVTKFVGG
jgi:hypothetical protein